jgi:hypothetical protein
MSLAAVSQPERFEILNGRGVFRPVGKVSLQQGVQLITAAIAFAREQNIRKLLVITTELTGFESPNLAARYFFMQEWAEAAGAAVRVAMVARPEMIDPQKFGVMVGANHGLISDVFTSEAAASVWLDGLG